MTTTMPPEMSATPTNPSNVDLSPTRVKTDPLTTALQASRSRFMITDILSAHQSNNQNSNSPHITGQQHQAALQHYIAQQQQLLQQRQQQQNLHQPQTSHRSPSSTPPPPPVNVSSLQHLPPPSTTASSQPTTNAASPHFSPHRHHHQQHHHSLVHSPMSALMGFSSVAGGHNGFSAAAAAAAHYAAIQRNERERERERLRDLDDISYRTPPSASSQCLDADDRSRSPQPLFLRGDNRDMNGSHFGSNISSNHAIPGGGDSSISGDQASTIDDSDSDCGAKDDDGNSIKSSDNLMGLSKKQRKARTAFTDHQLQTLEKSFERQKYLSVQDRMELANKLELSDCQVKTWYQNRRTKWKRQTAVGLELLAEAGNYAAFQRLYGGSPYLSTWPYAHAPPSHHMTSSTSIDLYYRQAAAAAVLQKPLSYRMYPSMSAMSPLSSAALSTIPITPTPISHLNASNSLQSLSSYYHSATQTFGSTNSPSIKSSLYKSPMHNEENGDGDIDNRKSVEIIERSCSPPLNPGSPPERYESNNHKKISSSSSNAPTSNKILAEAIGTRLSTSEQEANDEGEDAIEV
ncbi:uncharacterized protein LOC142232439 [Haematobia irritans]|uniref:uncharacterized protein LOC142232439 n=1 Tax=Haematobia irritans TaxID=7368 RepID=UPI003F506086